MMLTFVFGTQGLGGRNEIAGIQAPALETHGGHPTPSLAPQPPLYTPGSITKACPHLHTQPLALVSQEEGPDF